jgi:hypothetical protein
LPCSLLHLPVLFLPPFLFQTFIELCTIFPYRRYSVLSSLPSPSPCSSPLPLRCVSLPLLCLMIFKSSPFPIQKYQNLYK